jgi:hypothetical protein
MRVVRHAVGIAVAVLLTSCGVIDSTYVTYGDPAAEVANSPYAVGDVSVAVPESLRVSEADVYYPIADVVWRGEPLGNRYVQVADIFEDAIQRGTSDLTRGQPVTAEIVVKRFHALTEKTRYSFGGVYSIKFDLTIRDAATGTILDGPREVISDIPAAGGLQALAEEARGRTQRVVIVEGLARNIREAFLAQPGAE